MQRRACFCYRPILRAIRAGSCRADHLFIQIYFRMYHFVVKIFFASGGKGALTPLTKILWTFLHATLCDFVFTTVTATLTQLRCVCDQICLYFLTGHFHTCTWQRM